MDDPVLHFLGRSTVRVELAGRTVLTGVAPLPDPAGLVDHPGVRFVPVASAEHAAALVARVSGVPHEASPFEPHVGAEAAVGAHSVPARLGAPVPAGRTVDDEPENHTRRTWRTARTAPRVDR